MQGLDEREFSLERKFSSKVLSTKSITLLNTLFGKDSLQESLLTTRQVQLDFKVSIKHATIFLTGSPY